MTKQENMPKTDTKTNSIPKCGIIMPISPIDGCGSEHWIEILTLLKEVATEAGFEPNIVSDADESGIIQKRIIQNIYSNEIVICDVSGKNPNVMFELGMRLAFDKPTIIIKDDKTDYSFDTSVIEHLSYPRDLRFYKIIDFKEKLKIKLQTTYKKSKDDPNYSTFLKSFGKYKIAHLDENEITSENYILSSLDDIKLELRQLKLNQKHQINSRQTIASEGEKVVAYFIDKYLKENNIRRFSHIAESIEELYEYLENQEQVREICGHSNNIHAAMNKVLGK